MNFLEYMKFKKRKSFFSMDLVSSHSSRLAELRYFRFRLPGRCVLSVERSEGRRLKMSDNDQEEAMDNKEEVRVTLSVEWAKGFHQQKCRIDLEKVLRRWVNNKYRGDCKVLNVSEDGRAAISLKPASALSELQKLSGQQLTGREGKTVKIMSVSTPREEKVQLSGQRSAVSAAGREQCTLSVNHFWYVNHIYKEEIKRIEKENGVKIMAEVNVTFQGDQKDGDPQKALSEFSSLVQKCLGESHGSVIPLKGVNPEKWKDTVNIIQRKDNKLLLTVSSEEMTVCGPRQSQDAIIKSPATGGGATAGDSAEDEDCPICMDKFTNKKRLKCKHEFCEECLAKARKSMGDICPVCKDVFGLIEGDQPDGNMKYYESPSSLPGFSGCGSIMINYDIPSGIQTEKHSNPGKHYSGINRTAYLPNNKEGREVLGLLKKAFKQKLIFTVGTSRTTGMDNQVTWNTIHHKTSTTGGPQCFGYPDPNYLSRVKDELKAKGVE